MSNITNLLIALAFVVIGLVFLVSYFVARAKIVKLMKQTLSGNSQNSKEDSKKIIEGTKKMVWHLGIAYVTIALSLFFEGLSGVITSTPVVALFVIFGVLLFVYGVFMTAFGVLALYNENEQKYGKMVKAKLVSVCKLADGKQLLAFVADGSFGEQTLQGVEYFDQSVLNNYASNGGRLLDVCVVDDASSYKIGTEYLLYVSTLRIKTSGVNISFMTENGIEASVVNQKPEKKDAKPQQQKEEPKTTSKKESKKEAKAGKTTAKKASKK